MDHSNTPPPPAVESDTFLSLSDLKTRWRCSRDKAWRLRKSGKLPCTMIGGTPRFRLDHVRAYEAGLTTPATA